MRKLVFQNWCSRAVAGIRTSPDREIVSQELFDHLEDIYQSLIDKGMDPKEAQTQAIVSMGSPEEIAPQLAAIHRPFWGMVELFFRRAIVVLAFITALTFGLFFINNYYINPILQEFDPDAGLSLSGIVEQTFLTNPNFTVYSDGYTLTVDRVSVWQRTYVSEDDTKPQYYCNVQIKVSNPLPWADAPDFSGWYWAEDSLGNYYYSTYEDSAENECSIQATDYRIGFFNYVQDLWLSPYVSQDAEWIELHYDRSGRNIVMHIDLPGGELP